VIALKKLNGEEFVLNADHIEQIESTPDTRVKLTTGKVVIVRNSIAEVVKKVVRYKQLCNSSISVRKVKEGGDK
jgi:flagellar protein FlbD